MAQKIEVISEEIVKPSCSNNNHPKIHALSFFDQLVPNCFYVPLLFFYTNKNGATDDNHRSSVLKISLSAALSRYYPLAGRMKDDGVTVDCNDEGALFLETRIECSLSQVLENPQADQLVKLLTPHSICLKNSFRTGPVAVQITYFRCGGMSIGIYLCHKIMDMGSMISFIQDWALLARKSEEKISPEFSVGSLYPPLDLPFLKQNVEDTPEKTNVVSRRVVFCGSKIAKLKEMVADQVPNPTRVEVVSSLLCKSAFSANSKAISPGCIMSGFSKHAMNLRTQVSPPLAERNKGNVSGLFQVSVKEDKEVELGFLVKEFRKEKTQFSNLCADITNREDLCGLITKNTKTIFENMNDKNNMYSCSSWCKFPFYESDFGWGKPLWIATDFSNLNSFVMIDTREGDGIEAFVSLDGKAMALFEKDQELLSFSCFNPKVLEYPSSRV